MTVTWCDTVSCALTVTVLAGLTGAAVDPARPVAPGNPGAWASTWAQDLCGAAFLVVRTIILPSPWPLSLWRAWHLDTVLLTRAAVAATPAPVAGR